MERVVLLGHHGEVVGTADKSTVHSKNTPLHLAFSCYVLDREGHLLVTRRALVKPTWPGVWTNSFCGHPAPGESFESAIFRRAADELGAELEGLSVELPEFRYRAVDANGIVENELCPVYTATLRGQIRPNATEVAEWAWVSPRSLTEAVRLAPFAFSPWLVMQLPLLLETLDSYRGVAT
ncbi:isopentenyl-diphosphate Delta-isomerase [Lysinibacter sp. HNR]|uniref:isopentenyl-diphosphate Delta-isomerase n=1 Tax=Lysinibacter sp. HNR TaxID=3031408 RepID=UPI0024360DE6|nr:isopentenyl-diphosphate Delta-isomerase [Lysinibacter sp. HNR]WGD36407.1 isopentenyl-diphosphate Delta-isomerase [Lysinibacter sp. HNR]